MAQSQLSSYNAPKSVFGEDNFQRHQLNLPKPHIRFLEGFHRQSMLKNSDIDAQDKQKNQIGKHVSGRAKLSNLEDSKETVYGTLDSWVAWEQKFPIVLLKNALIALEKEQQWHRIIQVIKWMLSKGQGNTMGTYGQLILDLDMDNRAEEAHTFWVKKIGIDLRSVSWQLCNRMMAIYNRNNMPEHLIKFLSLFWLDLFFSPPEVVKEGLLNPRVATAILSLLKLFKGLEAFDRKPPDKTIVRKVANAYDVLGMVEEKDRLLEKYNRLFVKREKVHFNKSRDVVSNKKRK